MKQGKGYYIYLEKDMMEELKRLAQDKAIETGYSASVSRIVREAVKEYLDRLK